MWLEKIVAFETYDDLKVMYFIHFCRVVIQSNSIIVEKLVDANLSTIMDFSTILDFCVVQGN